MTNCPSCAAPIINGTSCDYCGAKLEKTVSGALKYTGTVCLRCAAENQNTDSFCVACKKTLHLKCRSCGGMYSIRSKQCSSCGADTSNITNVFDSLDSENVVNACIDNMNKVLSNSDIAFAEYFCKLAEKEGVPAPKILLAKAKIKLIAAASSRNLTSNANFAQKQIEDAESLMRQVNDAELQNEREELIELLKKLRQAPTPNASCFIATAVYGTSDAHQIWYLKHFRDNTLARNRFGKKFIGWYYENGPILADYISSKPIAKCFVKLFIVEPAVFLCKLGYRAKINTSVGKIPVLHKQKRSNSNTN